MKPLKVLSRVIPESFYNKIRRLRLGCKNGYDYTRFIAVPVPCSVSFIDEYLSNHDGFMEKMIALRLGLDADSLKILDNNIEILLDFVKKFPAINALYPIEYFRENFIEEEDVVFAENELTKQIREKYIFPASLPVEDYIFECSYGLKSLSDNIIKSLKGTDFLDCGANWGDSALILNEYGPKSIIAFEPVDDTYEVLEKVVKDNDLTDIVIPLKKGIGDCECVVEFYKNRNDACDPGICVRRDTVNQIQDFPRSRFELQKVDVIPIDQVVDERGLSVGLIKMDIEGAEMGALKGAEDTIKRDRPLLIISIYHSFDDYTSIKPYLENLDLGYRFMIRKLCKTRGLLDTVLIAYCCD